MYAFKVFVSTLIVLMIVMLTWAATRAVKDAGKPVAYMIIAVELMSLAAIWG